MEGTTKAFVGKEEFQHYLNRVKFGGISHEKIASFCDYLDGKELRDRSQSAQQIFLSQATKMGDYSPYYTEETEEYIKSDNFSNKIKKWILDLIKDVDGYDGLKKILESNENINDFDIETLMVIEQALNSVKREHNGEQEDDILPLFDRYMFALDGEGPCFYVKLHFSFKELALEFLNKSNIDQECTTVGDGLLVEYMMAIYRMYEKYMPEFTKDYVRLVKAGNFLSQNEFVDGYKNFVDSGFKVTKQVRHKIDLTKEEDKISNESRLLIKSIFVKSLDSLSSKEPLASVIKRLIYTMESPQGNDQKQ